MTISRSRLLDHGEALDLAGVEYDRLLTLLRSLEPDDWTRPTDCNAWDVADIVRHMLGAAASFASLKEFAHQGLASRAGTRRGLDQVDAMNEVQVRERAHLSPDELVAQLARVAPRALRARRRLPRPVRALPMQLPAVGRETVGYLVGPVLLRDVWMHRRDIAGATGREFEVDAEHDGRIVEDVVVDWAVRHGRPLRLELTGPAGGTYVQDGPGEVEEHRLDAVQFCRILAGRDVGDGVLAIPHVF